MFSRDPAVADYPFGTGSKPSGNWFRFGYPMSFIADVLQNLEVLAALGHGQDPRLAKALALVESKQDDSSRWKMEYTYNGKAWTDIEKKGQPSKWITLRALRVLKAGYARRDRTATHHSSGIAAPIPSWYRWRRERCLPSLRGV